MRNGPQGMSNLGQYGQLMKDGMKSMAGMEDAVLRNIEACKALSKTVRTSIGPNGMNKLVINHLEKLFVTQDCATILKELEVEHPAAKLIVMASKMQEQEIGDGTSYVVVLAGELLEQAEALLRSGLHTADVIAGYDRASKHALAHIETLALPYNPDFQTKDSLAHSIKCVIASKQHGYEDFLAPLIAEACHIAMPANPAHFNVDNVRVCKVIGGSVDDTSVVKGMVLPKDAFGTVKHCVDAKVAVYGCAIDVSQTETKGTVLIESAEQLLNYNKSEEENMEKFIKSVADAGVKILVTGETIGELAMHFIERHGLMAVKIQSKWQLRRFCRTVNAASSVKLEAPKAEDLGHVDSADVQEIGSTKCLVFKNAEEDSKISTIVVRGSTGNLLDDIERAVDDGVCVIKAMTADGRFVPGAAAADVDIALHVQKFADTQPGMEQYAINAYANSFEVLPRILAENSGLDADDILAKLYAAHEKGEVNVGVDVNNGSVADMSEAGFIDLLATRTSAMRLATEAAMTVLRVDQIIMAKKAGGGNADKAYK